MPRDASPRRKSIPALDVLRVLIQGAYVHYEDLFKIYWSAKRVQALFVNFGISFGYHIGSLPIATPQLWQDIVKAERSRLDFKSRTPLVGDALDHLLQLLMYVDLTESALYIIKYFKLNLLQCARAVAINGRWSVYTQLIQKEPDFRRDVVVEFLTLHRPMFYVSSEVFHQVGKSVPGWSTWTKSLYILLEASIFRKSIVAFEFARKQLGESEGNGSSRGDTARKILCVQIGLNLAVVERAQKWGYPPAITLANWFAKLPEYNPQTYLQICATCKSEGELRMEFGKPCGQW
jgi:hypothetical protein